MSNCILKGEKATQIYCMKADNSSNSCLRDMQRERFTTEPENAYAKLFHWSVKATTILKLVTLDLKSPVASKMVLVEIFNEEIV